MRGSKRLAVVLTERDQIILAALDTFRVMTREQVARLAGFSSISRVNARLLSLTRAGYLVRRFSGQVGVGRKAVYLLPGARWQGKFLLHQLQLNDVQLALSESRTIRLRQWYRFEKPPVASLSLIPDALALVEKDGTVEALFVELDRGTESAAVIRQKARGYLQLALSGECLPLFGVKRFRVVLITTSPRRAGNLAAAVSSVTSKLFFVRDFASINRDGFLASSWRRPDGRIDQPLL